MAAIYQSISYQIKETDDIVIFNGAVSSVFWLPVSKGLGARYTVKNIGDAPIVVQAQNLDRIEGLTNVSIPVDESIEFADTKLNQWIIIGGWVDSFGNATSYSEFDENGVLRMTGSARVWNDTNITVIPQTSGSATPATIAFNGDARLKCVAFSGVNPTADEIPCGMEVLHDYAEGTDVRLHIHWYPTNTTVNDVKWQLRYVWFNNSTVPPAAQTVAQVVTTSGTAWLETTTVFVLSGAGMRMGSRLVFSVFRDATDPQDTYAFNAAVTDIGIHYQRDGFGSRQVLVK